jgi:hypothetical protein
MTLQEVSAHLKVGAFTQEDMDFLGVKGSVTLDQMRAMLAPLLVPVAPAPQIDLNVEIRAKQSWEAAQEELKAAADRAALIQANADRIQAEKVQALVDQFKQASDAKTT